MQIKKLLIENSTRNRPPFTGDDMRSQLPGDKLILCGSKPQGKEQTFLSIVGEQ